MPQVVPTVLCPKQEAQTLADGDTFPMSFSRFSKVKRHAFVLSSSVRDTSSIYLLPLYCLSGSALYLDLG